MKFSLSIVPFHEPGDPDPYRRTFELCALAEDVGFDTVMIGHHHFGPAQVSDPFSLLAAIAARTSTIRLATAVFLLAAHHPIDVAERVATIDRLSNGRVTLGVGLGWNPLEYEAFGARLSQRGARLEEALGLLPRLWDEEDVASAGRFWTFPPVTVHPRPVQRPHPPLWVAGVAPAAIDRAARLGDAWICDPVQTLDEVTVLRERYETSCRRHGAVPAWVLRRYVWLGESAAEMERDWLPGFVSSQLAYWRVAAEGEAERALFARIDAGERVSPADVARGRFIGGSADDVVRGLRQCLAATGCEHLSIGFGGGISGAVDRSRSDRSFHEQRQMIRRFGTEVIPAFA
jgi:probable F420-dependent oxidoreductase